MRLTALFPLLVASFLGTLSLAAREEAVYGNNAAAAKIAKVNGIDLYYETYGEGEPLLLLHPNSGNIAVMAPQIAEFAKKYRVIAPDNRGHGNSGIGEDRLTYVQMAEDLNRLLEQLNLKSVHVVGWSDGGILGLLLAINHPDKVNKMVIMGANLKPEGAYDWAQAWVSRQVKEASDSLDHDKDNEALKIHLQRLDLLGKQPQIEVAELKKIESPVLVMAGDRDVIRGEHTLQIFESIKKSQLEIFPGATHMIPTEDPRRFNTSVLRFLIQPFRAPDTKEMFR